MRIGMAAVCAAAGVLGSAAPARAAAPCAIDALSALRVPEVSVTDARPVAAAGAIPAHCDVQGTVVTKGSGVADGLARFSKPVIETRAVIGGNRSETDKAEPPAPNDKSARLAKASAFIVTKAL